MTRPAPSTGGRTGPTGGEIPPGWRGLVAATVAVAAVYVYFLIFAQFGFLKALQAAGSGSPALLKPVLAIMGVGGMAGSVLMAWWHSEVRGRALLAGAFAVAGVAAGLTLGAKSPPSFMVAAALTGWGTGGATVALAAMIRRATGNKHLGLCLGAGTGLAYGFCNLPFVFQAGAHAQAVIALVAAGAGMLAAYGLDLRAPSAEPVDFDYQPRGLLVWVGIFLALVWLDSATFYVIQHNPVLQGGTWNGDGRLYFYAGLHFVTALLAGWALDRGWIGRTVLAAAALLITAGVLLNGDRGMLTPVALLYTAGVSFYSTALVFYPARSGRAGVAALVYAIAGWGGSALGIGMVENFPQIPGWFPVVAGVMVVGALTARRQMNKD